MLDPARNPAWLRLRTCHQCLLSSATRRGLRRLGSSGAVTISVEANKQVSRRLHRPSRLGLRAEPAQPARERLQISKIHRRQLANLHQQTLTYGFQCGLPPSAIEPPARLRLSGSSAMRTRLAVLFGEALELCRLVPFYSLPTARRLPSPPSAVCRGRLARARARAQPGARSPSQADRRLEAGMGWLRHHLAGFGAQTNAPTLVTCLQFASSPPPESDSEPEGAAASICHN